MALIRKHSALLGVAALLAILAISWEALSTVAWAEDQPGQRRRADDPFGGSDFQRGGFEGRGIGGEFGGGESGGGRSGRGGGFGGRGGGFRGEFGRDMTGGQADARTEEATPESCRQQVIWADSQSPASERIRRALNADLSSAGLDFAQTPLDEVVDFLRTEYEIEIQLDAGALDDLGIGVDEEVSVNVRNISLRSALRIMLRQLELTYVIADQVLLITTQEEAEARLTVAVYPVADLTHHGKTAKPLVLAILSTVDCETWADAGGEAQIEVLPGGLLVVSQTLSVHEHLADVLTAIRQAQGMNP